MEPKRVLFFFLSPIQRGLSGIYPALIKTMFQTTDVNRCPGGYIREKLLNFCIGVLQAPKKTAPRSAILGGMLVTSVQLKRNNFLVTEIISGASQHPKDVSFDGGCTLWAL